MAGNPPRQIPIGSYPPGWTNWLGWAIVGTIFGSIFYCVGLVTGIIAIVFAAQANSEARTGDLQTAKSKNSTAQVMTIITLVFAVIGLICIFIGVAFWRSYLSMFNL